MDVAPARQYGSVATSGVGTEGTNVDEAQVEAKDVANKRTRLRVFGPNSKPVLVVVVCRTALSDITARLPAKHSQPSGGTSWPFGYGGANGWVEPIIS